MLGVGLELLLDISRTMLRVLVDSEGRIGVIGCDAVNAAAVSCHRLHEASCTYLCRAPEYEHRQIRGGLGPAMKAYSKTSPLPGVPTRHSRSCVHYVRDVRVREVELRDESHGKFFNL